MGPGMIAAVAAHGVALGGAAAAHSYGPELWPEPNFASSTGLNLARFTVSGGQATSNGSGVGAIMAVSVRRRS